jgi:hypothetical protein
MSPVAPLWDANEFIFLYANLEAIPDVMEGNAAPSCKRLLISDRLGGPGKKAVPRHRIPYYLPLCLPHLTKQPNNQSQMHPLNLLQLFSCACRLQKMTTGWDRGAAVQKCPAPDHRVISA